jgi:hypothetical protein
MDCFVAIAPRNDAALSPASGAGSNAASRQTARVFLETATID